MAETATSPAPAADKADKQANVRPPKPDENLFKQELAKAEKEHKASMDRLAAVKAKIEIAMPNKNKDQPNPTQKRRQELIAQANEIRQKQAGGKNARSTKLDQIKRLDEQVRSRINEQKAAKSKVPFKSLEDLDRQIASLDKQVNSGTMKLVDEKKALSDISSLRKMRKNFGQLDDSQKQIDDLRAKIKEIKDSMDDPEQKALSDQYNKIQAEIDAIKAEQDEAYKGLSSLRDERSKLQAEQQEKYTAIRKLKDDYYGQKKAYQAYDREARERYREKQRAEQERYHQERKKAEAERRLGDASDPAYLDEIRRAHSLLQFLDPNHKVEKGPLMADTGLGAQAQRSVDESGLKGTKLLRKEDRDEEYAPAVKKGKKGKKTAHGGSSNKFNVPPAVVEDCAAMGIDPPMSAADIPAVAEKVRAKLDFWKKDQDAQTQRNIEKAKKEIAELEAAEANGDKVEQTTADLKETSITDKQES
ncbi:brefeldin A resistance BFR1 (maintenance of normal ploidy) [Fusarium tjaetaba]|uniref:Brefeldin A resistance BFR1 (Maintenance of normal ploidy) n=1 Tax=Fusarium tjaetaba TaxID=1567544 RepID=A0A8H5VR74_9HYPO|nr:brefeldin A resistance BFR1 (maintenance of normal ploidy) [Fusarium tjaetaba]KAF5634382.1 brefeldin A resistance BFR1 (maintenance of normal ploidy) [Fusarium tjaetaba]